MTSKRRTRLVGAGKADPVPAGVTAFGLPGAWYSQSSVYSQADVTGDDIAEVIGFVLTRPRHVAINEILLRPAGQL